MKKILPFKLFVESSEEDFTNSLLDKISAHGVDSLTSWEKNFLDSHKAGKEKETLSEIEDRGIKNEFSDTINGIEVKFLYSGSKLAEAPFFHHYGTLLIKDGPIKHRFEGNMSEYYGTFITSFKDDEGFSDWDAFQGNEYEYEQFIELIFGELQDNYKLLI